MLEFVKYSATGNDFIVIDDRNEHFDPTNSERVANLCDRRNGIGADGILLLRRGRDGADFSMIILNSDGSRPAMCGNGTRAMVHFAHFTLKLKPETQYSFATDNGLYKGEIVQDEVRVQMTELYDERTLDKKYYQGSKGCYYLNTGVPHVVIEVADADKIDLAKDAPSIRHDQQFVGGANVNFVTVISEPKKIIKIRTFERGVEGETLACGTGVMAAAVSLARAKNWSGEMTFHTNGGPLRVVLSEDFATRFFQGKVIPVFRGQMG